MAHNTEAAVTSHRFCDKLISWPIEVVPEGSVSASNIARGLGALRRFLHLFPARALSDLSSVPWPMASIHLLGSGPEGADDLCFHTGEISPPSSSSSSYPPPASRPKFWL